MGNDFDLSEESGPGVRIKNCYKIEKKKIGETQTTNEIVKREQKKRKDGRRIKECIVENDLVNETKLSSSVDALMHEKRFTTKQENDYQRKRSKLNNLLFQLEAKKKTKNIKEIQDDIKEINGVVGKFKQQNETNQYISKHFKNTKKVSESNERYRNATISQIQRRLVANARERSRVHALSNAFNLLRTSIPSYSPEQKLSKLTILRVAINYISALEEILVDDNPSSMRNFAGFVDECTCILQTEYGRSKFLNHHDR